MKRLILREYAGLSGVVDSENSYQASLVELERARRTAEASGDLVMATHARRASAECLRRLGRLDAAEAEFVRAKAGFERIEDHVGLGWTVFSLASLHRQRSRFSDAFAGLQQALGIAQLRRNPGLAAYACAGIAETTRIKGDFPRAYQQHLIAHDVFRALDDVRGAVWALEGVGQILKNTGRPAAALRHFGKARRLAASCGDSRGLAYALKCEGECLALNGHGMAAVNKVHESIEIFDRIGLVVGQAYATKAMGDVLLSMRDPRAAAAYSTGLDLFRRVGDSRGEAYTTLALGELELARGATETAAQLTVRARAFFFGRGIQLGIEQTCSLVQRLRTRESRTSEILDEGVPVFKPELFPRNGRATTKPAEGGARVE